MRNACDCLVQNFLPSRLLFGNTQINIYGTIDTLVVLSGIETWSVIIKEDKTWDIREYGAWENVWT
jgi:hypothetical protein